MLFNWYNADLSNIVTSHEQKCHQMYISVVMSAHASAVVYGYLRQLPPITLLLSIDDAKTIVDAFVFSRPDYLYILAYSVFPIDSLLSLAVQNL